MSAKLIVIEGLDASGKATQAKLLADSFTALDKKTRYISFPDYDSPSSSIIKLYLEGGLGGNPSSVNAYASSSFYAIDRYISYNNDWKEFYRSGDVIIANRYTTSNAVYQMNKIDLEDWDSYISWLEDYEYKKLCLPSPDLVIYLDMPNNMSQKLMDIRYKGDKTKKDIHESDMAFLEKCRRAADYMCRKFLWKKIKCYNDYGIRNINEIAKDVFEESKEILYIK